MTEYWKSTAKKFCEICKVWFGDNRASIEHHEMGQKHKDMVQQRLREMGKKSKQKDKEQAHLNATLVAMEAAAREAMKRDGQIAPRSMAPPMVGHLPTTSAPSPPSGRPAAPVKRKAKIDPKEELKQRKQKLKDLKKTAATSEFWNRNEEEEIIEWVQAEADGGFYYWNIFSGETVWEVPSVFYSTEEYSQNYEKIQKQIEDEKKRLKEEEEQKKREAENAEAMKQYNEQYQQYYQQWYEYQVNMQAFSQAPPPPPPPEEESTKPKKRKDRIRKEHRVTQEEEFQPEIPEGLVEVPVATQGIAEEEEVKADEEQPRPECTVYEPLTAEEAEPPKRSAFGLGKWTPVIKEPEIPKFTEWEQKQKVVYDDLPDPIAKPELDFEVEEDPSETQFAEKVLKVKSSKKDKPIVFQKRKARNQNQRRTGTDL